MKFMTSTKLSPRLRNLALVAAMALLPIASGSAQEQRQPVLDTASQAEIQQFCTSIADPARDQRYLLQKQELEKLQADVDQRIAVLEQRRAEYEDWLTQRNAFMKQAEGNLVEIYKTMKADAAAPQLQEVNPLLAAAIIMKLPARQSSLILSEMDSEKAAMLANIISSASDPNTSKEPS